jgi:hypothetical protein
MLDVCMESKSLTWLTYIAVPQGFALYHLREYSAAVSSNSELA